MITVNIEEIFLAYYLGKWKLIYVGGKAERMPGLSAEKANAAKSTFLTNMSHDIRTPTNAILSMTAMATANIDDRNKVLDRLSKITPVNIRLPDLINDVPNKI